jgi:hypothetical protein
LYTITDGSKSIRSVLAFDGSAAAVVIISFVLEKYLEDVGQPLFIIRFDYSDYSCWTMNRPYKKEMSGF